MEITNKYNMDIINKNILINDYILPYISYLWIVIAILTVWAWIYIHNLKSPKLLASRHWIEMIPSAISTLGVLGTFLGITLGLLCFDTNHLTTSIPQLLEGLKTEFFTSLAGMIGSLILSKKINTIYDRITGGVSDIEHQAQIQQAFYNQMQTYIEKLTSYISSMNINVGSLSVATGNIEEQIKSITASVTNIESDSHDTAINTNTIASSGNRVVEFTKDISGKTENISNSMDSVLSAAGNIEELVGSVKEISNNHASTSEHIDSRLGELMDHTEAIVTTESEVSEKIGTLTDRLHGEVVEIEDKMDDTNKLLEKKFDEFSELLKKNNTEALVEVMTRVTEEFQSQMNALIEKLVQENFDQLNKSVEKLNQWQMENKEMIQSLTSQYKQMADNFSDTSDSLKKVKEDTRSLVSDGGRLEQLVSSLNEVIIQDEKFKQISADLQKTADLSKSNMESFDQSTRQLNDWVKKQRNFTDSVAVLIQKLEEINEMRNYASQFWEDTRSGMNDAVGIISDGTEQLNQQISGLNQQFYSRLSTTLAQLDACIQSLITNAANNR